MQRVGLEMTYDTSDPTLSIAQTNKPSRDSGPPLEVLQGFSPEPYFYPKRQSKGDFSRQVQLIPQERDLPAHSRAGASKNVIYDPFAPWRVVGCRHGHTRCIQEEQGRRRRSNSDGGFSGGGSRESDCPPGPGKGRFEDRTDY